MKGREGRNSGSGGVRGRTGATNLGGEGTLSIFSLANLGSFSGMRLLAQVRHISILHANEFHYTYLLRSKMTRTG